MAEASTPKRSHPKPRRPFLVTVLTLMVLSIIVIHLVRLVKTLSAWEFLSGLPGVSPIYLALSGLVVTLIGLLLSWGLWWGRPGTPTAMRIFAVVYTLYEWLDRYWPLGAGGEMTNWPFAAGLTALILAFIFLALSRANVKAYYGERHEQFEQD